MKKDVERYIKEHQANYYKWRCIYMFTNAISFSLFIPMLFWVFWPKLYPSSCFSYPAVMLFFIMLFQINIKNMRDMYKEYLDRWQKTLDEEYQ